MNKKIIQIIISLSLVFSLLLPINSAAALSDSSDSTKVSIDGIEYVVTQTIDKNGTIVTTVTDGISNVIGTKKDGKLKISEKSENKDFSYTIDLNSQLIKSTNDFSIQTINSVYDMWWGFTAYYNTSSADLDFYWRNGVTYRNPAQLYYFTAYGTPLMSYSDSFYYEVNQLFQLETNASIALGAAAAAAVAGGLAAMLSAGTLIPAIILGVVAAYITCGAVYAFHFVNAVGAANAAEYNYSRIADILGY